ncbi:hypothetical protein IX318_001389 [Porphyromonas levii]|nr:hypothetical protein [Porphyromonas levii]MBR8715522.1 hypothetical protein [Porphyromonas levii]MBR8728068.1 hypothetical protein [Porphyromonas levii]MBR8736398.1 hypothetical protein [Porphyromonas levii]MBR8766440.1 hypothetical protein [Porphyromonas levii]
MVESPKVTNLDSSQSISTSFSISGVSSSDAERNCARLFATLASASNLFFTLSNCVKFDKDVSSNSLFLLQETESRMHNSTNKMLLHIFLIFS